MIIAYSKIFHGRRFQRGISFFSESTGIKQPLFGERIIDGMGGKIPPGENRNVLSRLLAGTKK
jgi:hypothetical protein